MNTKIYFINILIMDIKLPQNNKLFYNSIILS